MEEKTSQKKVKRNNREVILDVAEKLFSVNGLAGVSIRQITSSANVDLSLVNYYFGTKDKLFEEVLIRRVGQMSRSRMERLSELDLAEEAETLNKKILSYFILPLIGDNIKDREKLANYRRLIALVANSRKWQDLVFKNHYDAVAEEYIDILWRVNSHKSRKSVCWAFNFFLGSLTNAIAETGRIDRLSYGDALSSDLDEMAEKLIEFTDAGLRGTH
jgi:AcrR family transcriptional regulator